MERPGCGLTKTLKNSSTIYSSTKPDRCHWPWPSQLGGLQRTWCCSAIHNSLSNRNKAHTPKVRESRHWIRCHIEMYEYFGGVPAATVPDNEKTGVTHPCLYEPDLNPTYAEMADHYGTAVIPTRARKPRDKAKVEGGVLIAQRWILAALRNHVFFSVQQANEAIAEKLEALNGRKYQRLDESRRELFEQLDRPALKPLPASTAWVEPRTELANVLVTLTTAPNGA